MVWRVVLHPVRRSYSSPVSRGYGGGSDVGTGRRGPGGGGVGRLGMSNNRVCEEQETWENNQQQAPQDGPVKAVSAAQPLVYVILTAEDRWRYISHWSLSPQCGNQPPHLALRFKCRTSKHHMVLVLIEDVALEHPSE